MPRWNRCSHPTYPHIIFLCQGAWCSLRSYIAINSGAVCLAEVAVSIAVAVGDWDSWCWYDLVHVFDALRHSDPMHQRSEWLICSCNYLGPMAASMSLGVLFMSIYSRLFVSSYLNFLLETLQRHSLQTALRDFFATNPRSFNYLQPTQVPSLMCLYTMRMCAQKITRDNIPPDWRWLLFWTPMCLYTTLWCPRPKWRPESQVKLIYIIHTILYYARARLYLWSNLLRPADISCLDRWMYSRSRAGVVLMLNVQN